jgi:hypothetical protein
MQVACFGVFKCLLSSYCYIEGSTQNLVYSAAGFWAVVECFSSAQKGVLQEEKNSQQLTLLLLLLLVCLLAGLC